MASFADLAAGYQLHSGPGIAEWMARPRPTIADYIADVLKEVGPQIAGYIKQKKTDDIANQLMNMENPPRATAVDPSVEAAAAAKYGTYGPSTTPFTGGEAGMKVQNLYQKFLDAQQADQVDAAKAEQESRYKEALIGKILNPSISPGEAARLGLDREKFEYQKAHPEGKTILSDFR